MVSIYDVYYYVHFYRGDGTLLYDTMPLRLNDDLRTKRKYDPPESSQRSRGVPETRVECTCVDTLEQWGSESRVYTRFS